MAIELIGNNTAAASPTDKLVSRLVDYRAQQARSQWEGNFNDYFQQIAVPNPRLASTLSHGRIAQMIAEAGVSEGPNGQKVFNFFKDEIFGAENSLQQLVEYFGSSARRLDTRKRILLFMGPVGGGKSTIVTLLKRGLEQYTRTDTGAVYAIQGCPMNEDPLHLIPEELRPEIKKEYGLDIEGDLCPSCRQMIEDKYHGKVEDVRVERVFFSEKNRIGIGTFSPSDPKSQDITELTGSIDLSTIGDYGVESDPRAYRFDGELNIANRGMMEFIEMLKADEKFLYGLLTLSQEQNIKVGRFAMIYADEVVISHTNENEYNAFVANKKSEALQDRIIVVKVPYNLRVTDEERIYQKLIGQSTVLKDRHIAPHTLQMSAMWAVLSRLEEPKKQGMTLMKKLKLYDGEEVEDFKAKDVKGLQAETVREGMDGISPRYVINRLSTALVQDNGCINPIDALRSLRDGLSQLSGITEKEKERLFNLLAETRKEYDHIAKNEVQKAFVYSFEDSAKTLLNVYLDNIEAFCNRQKIKDPITEEEVEPDERMMRSIEEQIGVGENAKKNFREEILIRLSSLVRKGQTFSYASHDRLREAIEKKLFTDLKDIVKVTTSVRTPDAEQLRKVNEVAGRLQEENGYCPTCANELLKYVGSLLNR